MTQAHSGPPYCRRPSQALGKVRWSAAGGAFAVFALLVLVPGVAWSEEKTPGSIIGFVLSSSHSAQAEAGGTTLQNMIVPRVAQAGYPMELTLSPGVARNAIVTIGGKIAQTTPTAAGKLVVQCPPDVVGPAELHIQSGDFQQTMPFRSVLPTLTAARTNLLRGQRTTLTVRITGLQELMEPVQFQLQNNSPDIVEMQGGQSQSLTVPPSEVQSDGSWTKNLTVTGVRSGVFNITATVIQQFANVSVVPATTPQAHPSQPEMRPAQEAKEEGEEYFLPAGMATLNRANAQKYWASPFLPPGVTAWNCCCCCTTQAAAPPASAPPATPSKPAINITLQLDVGKFGQGKAIHITYVAVGGQYLAETYLQWSASGGSGQLTVDLAVQRPASSRWDTLATGRGPNDEFLFSTTVPGTYLFKATVRDSSGQSQFNTLSVTFPRI